MNLVIYLVNKFEEGQWHTVRWFASLPAAAKALERQGFVREDLSWVWTKEATLTEQKIHVNITTANLEG